MIEQLNNSCLRPVQALMNQMFCLDIYPGLYRKTLIQKGGELIAEILGDDLDVSDSETFIELNFAVLKFQHTVKKKKS